MTTRLSNKLAALGVALVINGLMISGVGYLFSARFHQSAAVAGFAHGAVLQSITPTI